MKKRGEDSFSIGDVLKDFVDSNKLQQGLNKVAVQDVWAEVMGPAIVNYTHSIKLDRETLYIELTSSVLREELSYGRDKIISNLNAGLKKELIKKLVLR
ncbi:DUF721 domain-containing protein [Aquimarina sp. W85]|uniref:DUF721 domain-containing protein n=1 Tax=Aquimarina rhodophyticola TaxID=3342246 RepID=UPI00366BA0EB